MENNPYVCHIDFLRELWYNKHITYDYTFIDERDNTYEI